MELPELANRFKNQFGLSVSGPRGEYSDPLTVERINKNHVYFYSGVDTDRGLALMQEIREADSELREEHLSRSLGEDFPLTPIWLHIYSGGGEIFAGLAIADQLKQIKTPIYSIVEGYCASAGTLISLACTKRFIQPSSFMMIHQLSGMVWGTYEELKDDMHIRDMLMGLLVTFYSERTTMSIDTVSELLQRNSWFNAQECIERGLVDGIVRS